jgi:hypothetical protein
MAIELVRQTFTWRDLRGHTGKTSLWLYYDPAVTGSEASARTQAVAMESALAALTNCALYRASGVYNVQSAALTYGAAADYGNAETKLRIRLLGSDASIHKFELPGPKVADFEADLQTAKASAIAATIALLVAAPTTSAAFVTPGGLAWSASLGGTLIRRKFQRKLTIYQKSANLDEPEM